MPDHIKTREELNWITGQVVDAAMKVHTALGPGLLESAYQACLAYELRKRGLKVLEQVPIPLIYDEMHMGIGYRADQVVEDSVVVELKAVEAFCELHEAQLQTHLNRGGFKFGLLFNFHAAHLKDGIRRRVNNL